MASEKRTPLYDWHVQNGGKMVPFAGYSMPVQYAGIQKEHRAVREAAGLFDVSHMGNVLVTGKRALEYLQKLTVNDVSRLLPLDVQYSAMCTETGGVVDDILVTYVQPDAYHVVINAANIASDLEWMEKHLIPDVELKNQSEELAIIALQGPKAVAVAQKVVEGDLKEVGRYKAAAATVAGIRMVISRTGYTGEDGFEFFPKKEEAVKLWEAIMEAGAPEGVTPVGLGARDTLRLEAGLSLYGHELTPKTNLVEAGLSWIVNWEGPDFIGKKALLDVKQKKPERKMVGLRMLEKALPREGYPVVSGKETIGVITSGGLSPCLNQGIALAYLQRDKAVKGDEVEVLIRDRKKRAVITARRFYPEGKR